MKMTIVIRIVLIVMRMMVTIGPTISSASAGEKLARQTIKTAQLVDFVDTDYSVTRSVDPV